MTGQTGLLVSVRNGDEVSGVLGCGVSVVDVKEPMAGPLGYAGVTVVRTIGSRLKEQPERLSVALGEVRDWSNKNAIPALPCGVRYAKLGLSGLERDWEAIWLETRMRFDEAAGRRIDWIAVCYVDETDVVLNWERVLEAAVQTGCVGLLLDTCRKTGRGIIDHVNPPALERCRQLTRQAGLLWAVAGQVRESDLPRIREFEPDLIGMRGGVCRDGNRQQAIDPQAVRRVVRCLSRPM